MNKLIKYICFNGAAIILLEDCNIDVAQKQNLCGCLFYENKTLCFCIFFWEKHDGVYFCQSPCGGHKCYYNELYYNIFLKYVG